VRLELGISSPIFSLLIYKNLFHFSLSYTIINPG